MPRGVLGRLAGGVVTRCLSLRCLGWLCGVVVPVVQMRAGMGIIPFAVYLDDVDFFTHSFLIFLLMTYTHLKPS